MKGRRLLVAAGTALLVAGAGLAGARQGGDPSDPVLRAITTAAASGAVSPAAATGYRQTYRAALAEVGHLKGVRGQQLASEVTIARGIAARGSLIPSRMPLVFLTLARNVQWWGSRGPPPAGSGVEPAAQGRVCKPLTSPDAHVANLTLSGSGIVYEYYPGLGLQLQVNATFGSVNALLTQGSPRAVKRAGKILDQMLTLASYRQGHLTWEYEFPFEGAEPPWTSGLSQATAIEALTRAAAKLHRRDYLVDALKLAQLFAVPPPTGVRTSLPGGDWFLLYSFDPGQLVLNADLDAVVALHDLRVATHAPLVAALAHSGLHTLERNIGRFNTGSWSLYSLGGPLTDLNYHALNLELAQKLCQRTRVPVICGAARSFRRELNARCPVVRHDGAAAEAASEQRYRNPSAGPASSRRDEDGGYGSRGEARAGGGEPRGRGQ